MSEILFSVFVGLCCVWIVIDIITKVRSWERPSCQRIQEHDHKHEITGHVQLNTPGRFG